MLILHRTGGTVWGYYGEEKWQYWSNRAGEIERRATRATRYAPGGEVIEPPIALPAALRTRMSLHPQGAIAGLLHLS